MINTVQPGWHLTFGPLPQLAKRWQRTPPWTPPWLGKTYRVQSEDGLWSWITHVPHLTNNALHDLDYLAYHGYCFQVFLHKTTGWGDQNLAIVITEDKPVPPVRVDNEQFV